MRTPSGPASAALILLLAGASPARAAAAPEALSAAAESGFALAAGLPAPAPAPAALRAQAAPPPAGTPSIVPLSRAWAPTTVAPLPGLLDNLARTRATFRAGDVVVHVFGQKSRNKGDWFVGFAAEGSDAQWINGRKLIHWMLLKRTAHFQVGDKAFSAYLQGQVKNRLQSRLIVAPDDRSSPPASWSIQEISDDGYEAGFPVVLGGRQYRLFYARDFDQGPDGDFAGYAAVRSIVLVARVNGRFTAYHWLENDIPRDGVLSVAKPAAFADDGAEMLRLGLRLRPDGGLEIYDLAVPPAA